MPPLNAPQYTPATGIGTISPDKKWKYTQQGWVKNEPVAPPPAPPAPTIPQGKSPADNLVNYKSAANQVLQLARDKRAELMLQFMGTVAPPGTMAASDFSSILSGMQRAGERTIEMATKDILERQTPVYDTFTSGGNLYEIQKDPVTKQIIGTPRLIQEKTKTGKDEVMTFEDLSRFKWTYNWAPPYGFTENQLEQFMKDNPTATPEELEEGAKQALMGGEGEIQKVSVDDVISYILSNINSKQEKILKNKADEAGISSMWKGKGTDVKNYLNSLRDRIEEALESGYSKKKILEILIS